MSTFSCWRGGHTVQGGANHTKPGQITSTRCKNSRRCCANSKFQPVLRSKPSTSANLLATSVVTGLHCPRKTSQKIRRPCWWTISALSTACRRFLLNWLKLMCIVLTNFSSALPQSPLPLFYSSHTCNTLLCILHVFIYIYMFLHVAVPVKTGVVILLDSCWASSDWCWNAWWQKRRPYLVTPR